MDFVDILISWLVTGVSLLLISRLPIGIEIDSTQKGLAAAAVLGGLNALVLPLLRLAFAIPNLLTLGLLSGVFAFVMNVIVFSLAAKLVDGFRLPFGIWSAVIGAVALAIASNLVGGLLV